MQVQELKNISFFQDAIQEELRIFSERELPSSPEKLYGSIKYALTLGGKRTRPLAVLLGCDLFGGTVANAMPAAIAVELFHNFTLVHDDIMDAAPLRRNAATVHKKWNANVAILGGDAMLVKTYQLLNTLNVKNKSEIIDVFNSVALKVCEGQQMDMDYETMNEVTIADYLLMIELKTAVLLAGSFKIGALVAGANSVDADKIYEFGKQVGIAFQLKDDILDVYGDSNIFGKQRGRDIISNKKTFLLLKALELSKKGTVVNKELYKWINAVDFNEEEKVNAVVGIYDTLGVKKMAEEEMIKQYDKALECLSSIGADEEKKKQLSLFSNSLMNREV